MATFRFGVTNLGIVKKWLREVAKFCSRSLGAAWATSGIVPSPPNGNVAKARFRTSYQKS